MARKQEQYAPEVAAAQREAALKAILAKDTAEILSSEDERLESVSGAIVGADPEYRYYVLDVTGLREDVAHRDRMRIAGKGYKPVKGPYATEPGPEYSTDCPEAEIWRIKRSEWEIERTKRRIRLLSKLTHLRALEASRNHIRAFDPEIRSLINADQSRRSK